MLSKLQSRIANAVVALALLVVPTLALAGSASAQTPNVQSGVCTGSTLQFTSTPQDCNNTAEAQNSINNIVTTVVNIFSIVVGIVAVIMIIVGGFKYITSGGDSAKVTSAKNSIVYAIIGLVIVALAQIIVQFVLNKATQTGTV